MSKFASVTEVWAGTDATKVVTSATMRLAQAFQTLADASTVTPNFNLGINFKWTRTATSTLAAPTGLKEGWSGTIRLDGPGSITFADAYDFAGVAVTPSTATGTFDYLDYQVVNAAGGTKSIRASFRKAG